MSRRTKWELERRGGLGGSDVAKTAQRVYGGGTAVVAEKLGIEADRIDPDLADRGHRWEQPIADGVRAHTSYIVAGEQMRLTHQAEPRWFVHPDGLLLPDGVELTLANVKAGLEVKTRGPRGPWLWDYWTDQGQWGCHVSGLPRWLLAVATIDTDYNPTTGALTEWLADVRYRWIERDDARIAELVDVARDLWAWAERGELPPADGPEALPYVKAANARLCPNCDGHGTVESEPCVLCGGDGWDSDPSATADIDELAELIARREQIRAAMKATEAEADTIEAQLRQAMGDATEATTTDGTWRVRCGRPIRKFTSQSEADFLELYGAKALELGLLRTVLDRDKTKAEMPDEYDALRIATPDRRLTVKNLRPED